MNITIIAVGKLKETYLKQGVEDYKKRLSHYCTLTLIEVPDEKAPASLSTKEEHIVMDKEGEKILAKLPSDSYVIALDRKGVAMNSLELANKIEDIQTYNSSHITLLLGGSLGLSNEVLRKVDLKLSFSTLTFPHQLMRLILLEQLYRSFRINNNEPYHK